MMDDARFGRLRDRLGELHRRSRALARQLGDIDLSDLRSPADLAVIPVLRKVRPGRDAARRAAVRGARRRADERVPAPVRLARRHL